MRDLPAARRRRRGARRPRALRDPRARRLPHARVLRAATASRSSRSARAARRYEELHARGGGILSTVRATRAAGEDGLREARRARTAAGCCAHGTTTFEAKSGYGLDRDTELASLRAIRAAGGVPTWLGAHAVPPEFDGDGDAYLDFALAEVLPEAAQHRRGGRRLPRARRVRRRAGAPLSRGVPRGRARAAAPRRPVHRVGRDPARDRARRALGRPPRGDRRRTASRALAASDVVGVLLPASALFLGRPMPPARALVDAGAAVALATDFNPGSAFCESLPLVLLARRDAAAALAGGGARGLHGERRARARPRRTGSGRLAPGYAPTSSCSTRPTGATSRTTSAGAVVQTVVAGGAVARSPA